MRLFCIFLLQLIFILPGLSQKPKLYVFLPSEMRPHALRSMLEKECPQLEIKVFPRYREFRDGVAAAPPDAILSLEPVIDYTLKLRKESLGANDASNILIEGVRDDKKDEPYVFLSDKDLGEKPFHEITIGVVDLLGRREMAELLGEKLKTEEKLHLRTVTKLEDLLWLIQFQYVDAIFVPEAKISYYEIKSQIELIKTPLSGVRVGLPIIATLNSGSEKNDVIVESFKKLSSSSKTKLGVQSWSPQ